MVSLASLIIALVSEQRRNRGCVFPAGMGQRWGRWPLTQVALGCCLPSGRAGGWKHLVSRARALAADLWAHKASPSATGKGPRLPCVCQQRLQGAMVVDRAQHKQPPEKGTFVVSGGQLLDCQGLPAQCGWGRSWQVLPTHSLLWFCGRLGVLIAELGVGSRACGSLSFFPSFLSSAPLILSLVCWFACLYRFSFKRRSQTFPSVGHCRTACASSLACCTAGPEEEQKAPSLSPDFCHLSSSIMNSPRPFPWHMRTSTQTQETQAHSQVPALAGFKALSSVFQWGMFGTAFRCSGFVVLR